ncbi:hypothetical protein M427DRAFT_235556 [Gonapodya prolifera JEL478]|uniref:Uncharacterized protein n=1 Tax=Gonapodya prolifera (strain JEL478) TaxID=1344416 RepID=A0A139AMD5_GONPJ|nr:hypothetical protein M427DRAFT_235556 [Gonapodya prolifera JEL478]|eukprot:KXS17930.1 hypothetical protein M427DRAFT_235556 [Gonapodya prolifera JEL478]
MWILTGDSPSTHGTTVWLKPGKEVSIGRKDGTLTYPQEKSISRSHAAFVVGNVVEGMVTDLNRFPSVTLTDNSKFLYTFVNGVPSTEATRIRQVADGDQLSFGNTIADGLPLVRFRLKRSPVVLCLSGVPKNVKKEMTGLAAVLDLKIEPDWTDACTHLLMHSLKVTYKVVACLADCRHIVSDNWVRALSAVNVVEFQLPRESEFLPEVVEESVVPDDVNFGPDPRRRTLFKGRTFVFFTQSQVEKHSPSVTRCSGTIRAVLIGPSDTEDDILREISDVDEPIVVSAKDAGVSELENKVIARVARSFGVRVVNAEEIGYAVLFASTALHTNPSDDIPDLLATQRTQKTQKGQQKIQGQASGGASGGGPASWVKVESVPGKLTAEGGSFGEKVCDELCVLRLQRRVRTIV